MFLPLRIILSIYPLEGPSGHLSIVIFSFLSETLLVERDAASIAASYLLFY